MNKQEFFKFSFIVLTCMLIINFIFALTIFLANNPLSFSWHPDFFSGVLFGLTYFGTFYLGWKKT